MNSEEQNDEEPLALTNFVQLEDDEKKVESSSSSSKPNSGYPPLPPVRDGLVGKRPDTNYLPADF